jgi:hypothetical protein
VLPNFKVASIASPSSDTQGLDFLPQSIAIYAQDGRRLDLIAARGLKRLFDQRPLDLGQEAIIKPGVGQVRASGCKLRGEAARNGCFKTLPLSSAACSFAALPSSLPISRAVMTLAGLSAAARRSRFSARARSREVVRLQPIDRAAIE